MRELHSGHQDFFYGYAESRIGGRAENQDSYTFGHTKVGFLVTVCDGMGGGPGGKTASSIAVTEIMNTVSEAEADADLMQLVQDAVKKANAAILAVEEERPELKGMGSTATVLLLNEQAAVVAHVGDSRVYQFRGHQKVYRTFDHSMVFDMVRQNIITEEQARLSAQSNVITRALGVGAEVDVEVSMVSYERGDRFMLCTDGIHGTMSEKELIRLATEKKTLGAVADNIATVADELGRKEGGGHDNLTLAMIETKRNSKQKQEMIKKMKLVMAALGALLFLSVVLNVVLSFSSCSAEGQPEPKTMTSAVGDSLTSVLKQENKVLKDSIQKLNRQIKENKKQ